MTIIISFVQRKGGVGKTTLAVSVASELRRRGAHLALIDADPQHSACKWAELGHLEFPVYEMALADNPVTQWAETVRKVPYRCLIIDSSPNERSVAAAMALATIGVVPCTPSGLDIDATVQTLQIVRAVRQRRRAPLNVVLVPNRVDLRTLEGRQIVEELHDMGEAVGPAIGARSAFVRAFAVGRPLHEFAASSQADNEIKQLCSFLETRLNNTNIPVPDNPLVE